MSQENVEIVRRAIDAFVRRDFDSAFQDNNPEIELDWSRSPGVDAGIYHGYEAVRAFWSSFSDMFNPIIVSVDEFIERGEYVAVPNLTRFWGRGGVEVEARSTYVVRLRGGRIVAWTLYREREEALKAMGLAE
jgi:ketosteroid isomerase-like protein